MNPSNLQSQSSYVGLLNSQQGSVFYENFPNQSYQSSDNFGGSEMPAFSSQQSTPVDTANVLRRKWTPADDEVLISAWLNTSKDAIVGNDQKSATFWRRVAEYYASSPHGEEDGEREHQTCKKRWHRINDVVNKFCAAYSAAERQVSSGESATDILKKAHEIYFADQEHKFNLEHAWCLLRFEQKWLSLNTPKAGGGSKRKNVEADTQTPSTEAFIDTESRPEGIKAAKAKRNYAKGKSVAEYATIWEMKKKDLERKERLSKLAILDTLLTKDQPLSEAEEVVKNKLLAKYF